MESGSPLVVRITGQGSGDRQSTIAVDIVRLDGTRMFSEVFPASDYANGGRIELDLSMEPLVLGPGTYRLDAALLSGTGRAAECSAVCEVYAPLPPTGGKPMLVYPITTEVVPRAAW